jgi:hypothetical protein
MKDERLETRRRAQEKLWIDQSIRARFGSAGLAAARRQIAREGGPFVRERAIVHELAARLSS